jgi:hypothetical protein
MRHPLSTLLAFSMLIAPEVSNGQLTTWVPEPNLPAFAREQTSSFAIDGVGYVLGGLNGLNGQYTNALYAFDPATDTWTARAPHPWEHIWAAPVFTLDGLAYVIGGAGFVANDREVHVYDPVSDSWSPRADFPGPAPERGWGCSLDGIGYVCLSSWVPAGERFHAYDPATDTWTPRADPPAGTGTYGHLLVLNGTIHYIRDNGAVHAYDPATDQWSPRASRGVSISDPQVFILGGMAYTVSGASAFGPVDAIHQYDPVADQWTLLSPFTPLPRAHGFAFTLDDRGYVGSGLGGNPNAVYYTDMWSTSGLTTGVAADDARPVADIRMEQGVVVVRPAQPGAHTVEVHTATGALVYRRTWSGSDLVLPLSDQGPGLYLISVRSGTGRSHTRVVIP